MAKNSFNFQAKMGLDTKGFRKGVSQVNASLGRLKSTFSSLAAGIGLGLGFDRLLGLVKDTSVKLDTALNTLKNASNITKTFKTNVGEMTSTFNVYGQNLSFVKNLSSEYGQDLVSLTDSFAKFTAAANGTSIGLEDQKYIFEQLTKAAAAYHLSADRTADMMNAVVQMMSKGKVTAEELRRQLGNTLPGAFNIMAAAMGVSTAQLDQMMKDGKVVASEVLPLFAQRLEQLTKNANFESLQNSMNKFKNAWYDVVEASNSSELFKNLYDSATDILKDIAFNFKAYMGMAAGALITLLSGPPIVKAFNGINDYFKNFRANAELQIIAVEARLKKLGQTLAELGKYPDIATGVFSVKDAEGENSKTLELMKEYNELQLERVETYDDIGKAMISTQKIDKNAANSSIINIGRIIDETKKSERQIITSGGAWVKFKKYGELSLKGIVNGSIKMGKALLTALGPLTIINIALTAIGAAVGYIIGKMQVWKQLEEDIAEIHGGFDKRMTEEMAPTMEEIDRVDKLKKSFIELGEAGNISGQKSLWKDLQEAVPALKELKYEDIVRKADGFSKLTEEIELWTNALKSGAEFQAALKQQWRAQDDMKTYKKLQQEILDSGEALEKTVWVGGGQFQGPQAITVDTEAGRKFKEYGRAYGEAIKAETDAKEILKKLVVEEKNTNNNSSQVETDINKIIKEHDKNIEELKNQKREIIKALDGPSEAAKEATKKATEEIDEQINKAYIKAFEDAAATGTLVLSQIQEKVANGQSLTKMEQWYLDLAQKAAKATSDIAAKTAEDAAKKGIEKWKKQIKKEQGEFLANLNSDDSEYKPKNQDKQRDARLDYKKTSLDIATEEFDLTQEKADELDECLQKVRKDFKDTFNVEPPEDVQEFFKLLNQNYEDLLKNEGSEEALAFIKKSIEDLKNMQTAANSFKEVKLTEEMIEDLQELSKEIKQTQWDLAEGVYSDFTGLIGSIDSVASAFQRLNDVVEDVDSTGWDRFMASFDIFTSIMDTVLGTIRSVNSIMEFSNILADLQARKQANLNALKQQQVVTEGALAATTLASAGASVTSAGATAADAAASEIAANAKAKEAIAETAKQNSKMGPLGWIAAIAGVAGIIAALASMSKFEKGGIVGGNSTRGDRNIIRANTGEMILNKAQQGTLWNMLNGKGGIGGNVQFKIRGADLIGVINNENSRRRG